MARNIRTVFATLIAALALAGCLEAAPDTGNTADTGVTADTDAAQADTAGQDGSVEDTPAPDVDQPDAPLEDVPEPDLPAEDVPDAAVDVMEDVGDPCDDVLTCDDGDPCTDDFCEGGACFNVAIPSCVEPCDPAKCVDGDPCTTDECSATGECVNAPIPGCGCGCASDADCDDGDPCTITTCSNCECFAKLDPACGGGDFACNSEGVVPVSDVMWAGSGTAAKVAAAPEVWWDYGGCTKIGCPPGVCCNTCQGSLALADGTGTMPATELTDLGPSWSCDSDECGVTKSCAPPYAGVGYWMWGSISAGKPTFNGLVPVQQGWLEVEGWCLQTNELGLPGSYEGSLTFDSGETVPVTMSITVDAAGSTWTIDLSTNCAACPLKPQTASNVQIGDGWIAFTVVMSSAITGTTQEVTFNLGSWHNSLQGPFGTLVIGGPIPPVPVPVGPSGSASFTKDAPKP